MTPWAALGASAAGVGILTLVSFGGVRQFWQSASSENAQKPPVLFMAVPGSSGNTSAQAWPEPGSTDVADWLNSQMRRNEGKVYSGGKGLVVRNIIDGLVDDPDIKVAPATFWTDDIFAPSVLYPTGNPMMPSWIGNEDSWRMPVVAVVIAGAMNKLFTDFDNIQGDHWGYGVFYPADSNSVDQRCRWLPDSQGWECPGGWVNSAGHFVADSSKKGAGRFSMGNPAVYGQQGGGGAGCHFDKKTNSIDQINGKVGTSWNLVQDNHCQCNYIFAHNFQPGGDHSNPTTQNGWDGWVDDFANYGLHGNAGPTWQMDLGTCWVNNPRDMINMQNRIYWQRRQWLDGSVPRYNDNGNTDDRRRYWGWNEVPIAKDVAHDPQNWDSLIIFLPAYLCNNGSPDNGNCLNEDQSRSISNQLDQHVQRGALKPGFMHIRDRPGAYVLFVRQVVDGSGNWRREFFCQSMSVYKFKVVYIGPRDGQKGACYVDYNWPSTASS